jgi:hypothetical protein
MAAVAIRLGRSALPTRLNSVLRVATHAGRSNGSTHVQGWLAVSQIVTGDGNPVLGLLLRRNAESIEAGLGHAQANSAGSIPVTRSIFLSGLCADVPGQRRDRRSRDACHR